MVRPWRDRFTTVVRKRQDFRSPGSGNSDFEEALALDPGRDDAMQYLHFLFTQRSSMRQNEPPRRSDLSAAEAWLERATDACAEKVQTQISLGSVKPEVVDEPDPMLRRWASLALTPPPLPPPPSAGRAPIRVGE